MIMKFSQWFRQIAGCKIEDETGNVFRVVDYRMPCDNPEWLMIGLEDIKGVVKYCNLDRYSELTSIA